MAISPAPRAANSPAPDYAEQIVDEVRARIQAEKWVLDETRTRRNAVLEAAQRFPGALAGFGSGSLAHGTVNDPVSDGDGGVVLDRRTWSDLGPDSEVGLGPDAVMEQMGRFVCDELRDRYPQITFELAKRAILFAFHEPMDDEDPTVDLVICLTRRDRPGYWIPNRDRRRWDASDPEKHTALMTAPPKDLRIHRARSTVTCLSSSVPRCATSVAAIKAVVRPPAAPGDRSRSPGRVAARAPAGAERIARQLTRATLVARSPPCMVRGPGIATPGERGRRAAGRAGDRLSDSPALRLPQLRVIARRRGPAAPGDHA